MRPPVAWLRISLSLSAMVETPAGIEKHPRAREARPDALIRRCCSLRTTRPLLVQPLFALSALTPTLIVKKVGALPLAGLVSIALGFATVLSAGLFWLFDRGGWEAAEGMLAAKLPPSVGDPRLLVLASNSIDSTSSTYTVVCPRLPFEPPPTRIVHCWSLNPIT